MKKITLLLLGLLLLLANAQSQNKKAETYLRSQVNEQVYIHTDRDVYAPGDTIWFNAYIRNKLSLKKSDLSQLLYIFLVSKDSVILEQEKSLIEDSQSKGFIALTKNYDTEGEYNIVALSSWMNNFEPDCYFKKKILIRNDFGKQQKYTPFFNKPMYLPGDTVKVKMGYLENVKKEDIDKDLDFLFQADNRNDMKVTPHQIDHTKAINWYLPKKEKDSYRIKITDYHDFEKVVEIPYSKSIAIDFYPEGGNIVNSLTNAIAFKATYENGTSANISGEIVNEKGQIYTSVKTEHDGMGEFMLMPNKEEKYFFKINKPEQCKRKIEIPIATDSGWVLNARASSKSIIVDIRNSFSHIDTCYLALSVRGVFYDYKQIAIQSQAVTHISTSKLPSGIATLTLMDKNQKPIAERLVFANYMSHKNAKITPSKTKSVKLDSMFLKIKLDSTLHSLTDGLYSISVYDDMLGSSLKIDEPNIIASTYFNNELKGHINNPNYYVNGNNKMASLHLDLLLMVQGWRKYHYINQLNADTTNLQPIPQDLISGSLQKLKVGKGMVEIPGEVNVFFALNSTQVPVEKNGKFYFYPEYNANSNSSIMITGKDKKGKTKVNVTTNAKRFEFNLQSYLLKNPFNTLDANPRIHTFNETDEPFRINLDDNIWIEEVKVTAQKEPTDADKKVIESMTISNKVKQEELSASYSIESLLFNLGYDCRVNDLAIRPQLLINYRGDYIPVAFHVNGVKREYDDVKFLIPDDFEYFYIAKGVEAIHAYDSPVAAIFKIKDFKSYPAKATGTNPVSILGFQVYKEFYHPRYSKKEQEHLAIPDLRKTIYWNPNLKVNENGEASVSFYNAQRISKIKCVLQGISKDGNPVYGEAFYEVVRDRELP